MGFNDVREDACTAKDKTVTSGSLSVPQRIAPAGSWRAERWTVLAIATAFCALASYFSHRYHFNIVDDALISVRYAQNFALGRGVVFNPGERVEGYTNFLWMCVSALLYWPSRWLGVELVHALIVVNVLTAAAVIGCVWLLARRLWPSRHLPAVTAVGLTALDDGFGVWAVLGLEKHFVSLWALLALLLATRWQQPQQAEPDADARRPMRTAVAIGLCLTCAMLTRPDAGLFAAAFLASVGLPLLLPSRWRSASTLGTAPSWRALWVTAGVWIAAYAVYYAWRYSYFGYPLPNTFYLKVGGTLDGWERGTGYLKGFLHERAYVPLVAILALRGVHQPLIRTLLLWVASHVLYITHVGGDFYPGHRFFVAIVPALALLSGQVVADLDAGVGWIVARWRAPAWTRGSVALISAGLVMTLGLVSLERGPYRSEIETWATVNENNRQFSAWLGRTRPHGASMVVGDIGSAGYYADLIVYDVFGVIDPTIAHQDVATLGKRKAGHEKVGSTAYFMAKQPTYIKWGYLSGDLHAQGYYLSGEMPLEYGVQGLWQRDPLKQRGRVWQPPTFTFDRQHPGCVAVGTAFEQWPRHGSAHGQTGVDGQRNGYISSFHQALGDAATGTFETEPFLLRGDLLVLRVGGGHDPVHEVVELLVDGRVIAHATGRNTETLTRVSFDIAAHRGKTAVLRARDESMGPWGHIMLDEVFQWSAR